LRRLHHWRRRQKVPRREACGVLRTIGVSGWELVEAFPRKRGRRAFTGARRQDSAREDPAQSGTPVASAPPERNSGAYLIYTIRVTCQAQNVGTFSNPPRQVSHFPAVPRGRDVGTAG
jgi:hypothetical protein